MALEEVVSADSDLEFRIRIKVPSAVKLYETCHHSFAYLFAQLRRDFVAGAIIDRGKCIVEDHRKAMRNLDEGRNIGANDVGTSNKLNAKKTKFQFTKLSSEIEELNQRKEEHVNRISHVMRMMHLHMTVDILEKGTDIKSVIRYYYLGFFHPPLSFPQFL